jgi:hypothetical protein
MFPTFFTGSFLVFSTTRIAAVTRMWITGLNPGQQTGYRTRVLRSLLPDVYIVISDASLPYTSAVSMSQSILWLRTGRFGSIPGFSCSYSAQTGSGAHPASTLIGIGGTPSGSMLRSSENRMLTVLCLTEQLCCAVLACRPRLLGKDLAKFTARTWCKLLVELRGETKSHCLCWNIVTVCAVTVCG